MTENKPYEYFVKTGTNAYDLSVAVAVPAGTGTGTASVETRTVGEHKETFITIPLVADSSTEARVLTTNLSLTPQPDETDLEITTEDSTGATKGKNRKRYSQAPADDE